MEDNDHELYEKLSRLQWLLQRHRMMSHSECGPFSDTTRGQGRVLAALKLQPEISTKDLSYLLGIRVPSLNELLFKLEKGGYIVRKPSEADKRVMIIHLTEKGRETKQETADYSDIFDCLSEEEQQTFSGYLDRMIAALEAQVGGHSTEEELMRWMRAARSRMGNERFEQLLAMKESFGMHGCGPHGRPHGRAAHGGGYVWFGDIPDEAEPKEEG